MVYRRPVSQVYSRPKDFFQKSDLRVNFTQLRYTVDSGLDIQTPRIFSFFVHRSPSCLQKLQSFFQFRSHRIFSHVQNSVALCGC